MTEATTTTYPAARDPLPDIGPNTPEDGVGVEHDVMHAKVHALLNRLQDLVGLTAVMPPVTVLQRLAALELGGGGGSGTGAGEILVADGISPPELLTADDESDYLYEG